MKVLYLIESTAPYGANKSLIDLLDQVHQHGVTPFVVGSDNGPLAAWLKLRSIPYYSIGHRLSIYPKSRSILHKLLWLPKFFAVRCLNSIALIKLLLLCYKLKPDIIHTNIGPCSIGFLASRLLNVKHIWHLREYQDLDFDMHYFPSKKHFMKSLRKSNFVIFITDAIADHFSRAGHHLVINDGVMTRDSCFYDPNKSEYFLFAGRLEPTKGIEMVICAFINFCHEYGPSHKLLIAGDGEPEYVNYLKEIVKSSPFSGLVDFLGFRDDALLFMRKATALIVASRSEGFGRITPEAMFNGCLVIGRNAGGTADILSSSDDLSLGLKFGDEASLVQCMRDASTLTSDAYYFIINNAHKKAKDKYCVEAHGAAVLAVYNHVLSSSRTCM